VNSRGVGSPVPESADDIQLVAERLQSLQDGRKLKPGTSVAGVHLSITAPCGTIKQKPSRGEGFAAVLLSAVCAGSMESSNGNAKVTPTPRRNVRPAGASS